MWRAGAVKAPRATARTCWKRLPSANETARGPILGCRGCWRGMSGMQIEPRLSAQQLADLWGVSRQHVYNLVRQGKLQRVQIGDLIRFRPEDVAKFEATEWPDQEPKTRRTRSPSATGTGTSNGGTMQQAGRGAWLAGQKARQSRGAT